MGILETLWAREQIRDRLYAYCHGIDQRDWKLVRSCFGDDHHHTHGKFSGSADEFIEYASGFLKEVASSHHSISNAKIDISDDGKSAHCDANFLAFHKIEDGKAPVMAFPSNGNGTDWDVAGRYIDDLEFRDGNWLIVKRRAFHVWERRLAV